MGESEEILNLSYNERILMAKALARTGGNVSAAFRLNVPKGNHMSIRTYWRKVTHVYKLPYKQEKYFS